jgi:membrane protein YqaA with SNARE-associated domain
MGEAPPKTDSGKRDAETGRRFAYLFVEGMVVIVFVGAVVWLIYRNPPDGPLARALLNVRIWLLVLLFSGLGTAGALVPYYVGQQGTKAVFHRYPRLEGRPWKRLERAFRRWGSPILIFSGLPLLGAALLVGAGAFSVERALFLLLVLLGKILRNWVLVLVVVSGIKLMG